MESWFDALFATQSSNQQETLTIIPTMGYPFFSQPKKKKLYPYGKKGENVAILLSQVYVTSFHFVFPLLIKLACLYQQHRTTIGVHVQQNSHSFIPAE